MDLKDEAYRAIGLLGYAFKLDLSETIFALETLLFAVQCKIVSLDWNLLKTLLIMLQPGHLSALFGNPSLSYEEERVVRAEICRNKFKLFYKDKVYHGA